MSDNQDDGFDDIVNGNAESDKPTVLNPRSIMEALQQVYPLLYDGIMVRAVIVLDRIDRDGDRELMWLHGSDTQPWEALGMVQQVLHDMQAENNVAIDHAITRAMERADEDDDDEGEQ